MHIHNSSTQKVVTVFIVYHHEIQTNKYIILYKKIAHLHLTQITWTYDLLPIRTRLEKSIFAVFIVFYVTYMFYVYVGYMCRTLLN